MAHKCIATAQELLNVVANIFGGKVLVFPPSRRDAVSTQQQLKHLHDHSASLLKEQDIESMLAQVLNASIDLLKANKGWIHLRQPSGELELIYEVGFGGDQHAIERFSLLSSEACEQKRRITFDEVGLQPRYSNWASLFDEYQIGDVQATPLLDTEGRCFAVLSTCTPARRYFVETDVAVLDLYINQARRILTTKLQEVKLRKWSEDLEREVHQQQDNLVIKEERIRLLRSDLALMEQRERRQLASELHDYLCQLLAVALIKLKQVRKSLSPMPS